MKIHSLVIGVGAGFLSLAPFAAAQDAKPLQLTYGSFDPLEGALPIPDVLRAGPETGLWIAQSVDLPSDAFRTAIARVGGQIVSYLPEHAYVVRMPQGGADELASDSTVRWVGAYHPAYRLETFLVGELAQNKFATARRYNVIVADKHADKPALGRKIREIGGTVTHEQPGSVLFEVQLTGVQLLLAARFDEILWIDRWSETGEDMNNARIQGGGNYIETAGGYTGAGINGHIYEGIEAAHSDFTNTPINVQSDGSAQDHGHCTSGIVFGNGTSTPNARGMAPDAQPFYTNYSTVTAGWSRWQVIQELVTNRDVMFTTASWGNTQITNYSSISAEADDILFDHDIIWTQSQSNTGNQTSRPQAWAKNIMSIGGVVHRDNADRSDDSWDAGGASIGPAADGRIKPNLCAYYDAILCSDRTGSAGYASTNYYNSFGGTSGATPIVAGHNALALQMFTDHIFNNSPRVPGGTRFQNRPHNATHRALMYANARQYPFTASSTDNRREHQGWGFPDLKTMYDNRQRMFIVDETVVLTQGQQATYSITVQAGDPELKIAMCFSEPSANPAAAYTAINDLSLKVTAPGGTVYWGNAGLMAGNYSTAGGAADARDTVECVMISGPQVGTWTVEVLATLVAQDSHVETPAIDADFGLCVSFGTTTGGVTPFGQGCAGSTQAPPVCASINGNGGSLTNATRTYEYCYRLTTATPLQVSGFEVFSATNTGSNQAVTAYIYGASGSGPATSPLATTSVVIGSTPGFYGGSFGSPVSIPAGNFYIGINHSAQTTYLSNLSAGATSVAHYRSTPGSGSWSQSTLVTRPSVRALCTGGGGSFLVPSLEVSGNPTIGNTLVQTLSAAKPSSSAFQMVGFSDTAWGGTPLPFAMGGIGAPSCSLFVSPDVVIGVATSAAGAATRNLGLPNTAALVGGRLFEQFLVLDGPANALGVTVSNAVRIVIGD